MDFKTLLDNLHEEVSCSVCMTTFRDPKTLPCLHSFCLHCLQGIQRASGRHDIIICPECRRESRVPSGNLNDLPTNFRINSLLDVLAIKECNTIGVLCGNCDKKSSKSFYCFQCCAFWCEADCIILHNGIKANKEHRVLALKDFQDKDFENVLKRPAFCQKKHHEKNELNFFCKICETPICNACALTDHEGHAKMLLEEAANERKLQVKSVIESQKKQVQHQKNKVNNIEQTCIQIQEQAAAVKQNAQKFKEAVIRVMEAKTQETCNEVDSQAAESIQSLVTQKSEIEHQVQMNETVIEQTETLLERSTSAEIVQLDKSLSAICQEGFLNSESEIVDCDLVGLRRFMFVENKTLMDKVNAEGIGSLNTGLSNTSAHQSSAKRKGTSKAVVGFEAADFVLTTRNAKGEQCYDKRDSVKVEIRNDQGQSFAKKARVHDNRDGSYNISFIAKESGKYDVSVKVNGQQVHGSPFAVEVRTRQYRRVLSLGRGGILTHPWGVAVSKRGNIAVTDAVNNKIVTYTSDGGYISSFGSEGNKNREFNCPTGIGFDKNGNIIVADCNNHRVQRFSEQNDHLNTFSSPGKLDHQLNGPHGLSVDSDGNVVVADTGNKLIKIFYPTGQFLRIIGGESSFTYPCHCIQYESYLIVSDFGEHCIKVFDTAGKFLYKFGKKGEGEGEFNEPRGLSINKEGHLIVCDTRNHRVQVFELNGRFITKFGSGELNTPVSTAGLSDGRIAVADYGNSHVHIFR